MTARPARGDKPMSRRQVFLPDELWDALTDYALELSQKERTQISTAEAMRRILERSLKRRGKVDNG
jgi:hypothetical protein